MRQKTGAEIMPKNLFISEQRFPGHELVEDVLLHSISPPIYSNMQGVRKWLRAVFAMSPSPPYMPVHYNHWKALILEQDNGEV